LLMIFAALLQLLLLAAAAESWKRFSPLKTQTQDVRRTFAGARQNLYMHFLQEGHAPLLSLMFVVCNEPLRRVLGFLFANSYETKGSIKPQDAEKLENLWRKYLLDPVAARRPLAAS